jgi:hypothetical protein
MQEIMRRIVVLKSFRERIVAGKGVSDPEVLPAAIDWLDSTIAEHERDLDALVRKGVA